jgi:hypothetical protein
MYRAATRVLRTQSHTRTHLQQRGSWPAAAQGLHSLVLALARPTIPQATAGTHGIQEAQIFPPACIISMHQHR